jgi:drug/metabolite transporter (DMT)-like permease
MFETTKLALKYGFFALIATGANIGAQDIVVRLYSGAFSIALSVVVGTGVGLVVKYVLDKRYIFGFRAQSVEHDTRTFMLYAVMGLVTTVVFWGGELGFQCAFGTKAMRYLGGVIGLVVGYLAKYQLDKRFVFRK